MTGMSTSAAVGHLGMWMAMMVPMMLPSLVPMLSRYRRSVRDADGVHLHGLTALVAVGYFFIWAVLGVAVHAAGAGVMAIETRPIVAGLVLLMAGGAQLTSWKARQLALCREESGCGRPCAPDSFGAWRHGLRLGVRCGLCCGSLMLALLASGMMNPAAMAGATLAISVERLAPAPMRVARAVGVAIVVVGVLRIASAT
jgi:predicted metal-binding membrane protein